MSSSKKPTTPEPLKFYQVRALMRLHGCELRQSKMYKYFWLAVRRCGDGCEHHEPGEWTGWYVRRPNSTEDPGFAGEYEGMNPENVTHYEELMAAIENLQRCAGSVLASGETVEVSRYADVAD